MNIARLLRLPSTGLMALLVAGLLSWPAEVEAQVRRWRGRPVVVTGGFYHPFYGPFFHHPLFWGAPGFWGYPGFWRHPGFWGHPRWHPFWGPPMGLGPEAGTARLQVEPSDTEVYLDGHLVGVADDFDGFNQRLRVPPGEYVLTLYREGTEPWERPVLLTPGTTLRIVHRMAPLPPGETAPPRPVAPAATSSPPSGAATPPAREAALSLGVTPEAAEVLIDGESWHASAPGTRLLVPVSPGRHRVVIRKPGYATWEQDVEVAAGTTRAINIVLRPAGNGGTPPSPPD